MEQQCDTVVTLRYPSVSTVSPGGPTGNLGNRAEMESHCDTVGILRYPRVTTVSPVGRTRVTVGATMRFCSICATTMRCFIDIWVSVEPPSDKVSATTVSPSGSTVTLMKLQYVLVSPMVKLVTIQHHLDAPMVPLSHYSIFLCPHWYPSATKVSPDVSTGTLTSLQYLPMALREI